MNKPNKQINDKIKNLWNKNKGKSFNSFIKQNPDVNEYLEKLVQNEKWFQNKKRAFVCIANNIYEKKLCKLCNQQIDLIKACKGRIFCSKKCASIYGNKNRIYDDKSIKKANKNREKTNLERYGVKHPMQSSQIREKQKNNCLEKYGVENASQSDLIKEKRKHIFMKKYGVDHPFKSQEVKQKCKNTCLQKYGQDSVLKVKSIKNKIKKTVLKKYGCKNIFENQQIREKSKQTCLKRYGYENVSQNEGIKEKIKKTNLEKYGCEYVFQNKDFQQKKKKTMKERYGNENYFQSKAFFYKIYKKFKRWKDYIIPLFTKDEYTGHDKIYKWKCVKCGNEFEQKIYTTGLKIDEYMPRCLNCYPYVNGYSNLQKEVVEFIKSIYNGKIIENDRIILNGKELDIYLPEKRFAIEFDGLFWHNDKPENYHINKTELCQKQNIHLIHIFEDEWLYKQNIVKDRIKSILGIDITRIYARKCIIKEIDIQTSNEFLENNHLQGKDNAKIRYGLFYNDELVSVMTFGKPRFNKNYQYELIRFASKIGYQVIGGASKLLSYFKKNYKGSIISYADRRYSNGKLYEAIGFKLIDKSQPNYFYVKWTQKLSRYQCQKHKLKNILKNKFNSDLSESENMQLNGFDKIYDCGNLIFYLY